ncbi:Iron-sulfur cluster co-chaperone protein HscB, mitochondrial [Heracleum sosnowskyi]|uniref:Iron-sulfur cluster co-chaperone protein HscB, mitochondrial n=1 Tax=Heracleum sosnowskyi TaxID=360622 RepID=A0AAD8NDU8_9APIA|nr:Iron-sulfur cluster co-chaperone protein HscB, mitochondrial [Heracleum sosnowskyi]
MWRKLPSVFCIIRRQLLPKHINTSQSRSLLTLSSYFNSIEKPRVYQLPNYQLLANARFSGRKICSDSRDKLSNCWNCTAVASGITPFLFCQSCRAVQPVDHSIDYFHIFSLEKKFDIDDENLERKYKDWQKKLHPDLVHSKSKEEREYAAEQSARVIDAYRTLTDALARAMYIMRLAGVEVDEEQTVSESELLSEIMEIREAVEEAADPQALNEIKAEMQQKLRVWGESFAKAFQNKDYEEAQKSIQRMTYYMRVNEEIVKKL